MAEKKSSGKGLSKKAGPLPIWGWVAAAGGTFLVYRYIKARNAANASLAATGTTGGNLIPNDIGLPATTASGAGSFASQAAWTQAALSFLTGNGLGPADALNGVTNWLNGNCVTEAAYNGIAAAISSSSVGLPPGYSSVPTLSVCSSAASAPTQGGFSTETLGAGLAGYSAPSGVPFGGVITTAGGLFQQIPSWQVLSQLNASGVDTYYQPEQGYFVKTSPGQQLPANTPLFTKTG